MKAKTKEETERRRGRVRKRPGHGVRGTRPWWMGRYEAGDKEGADYLARDPDCRRGLGRGEIAEQPNQGLKGVLG